MRETFNPSDFTESQNNSINSKNKQRQTNFVQRLIDFAASHNQPVVGCVAAKLIAGLEPIKCNELLQALAKVAQARLLGSDKRGSLRPRTFTKSSPEAENLPDVKLRRRAPIRQPVKATDSGRGQRPVSRDGPPGSQAGRRTSKDKRNSTDERLNLSLESEPLATKSNLTTHQGQLSAELTSESNGLNSIELLCARLKQFQGTLREISQVDQELRTALEQCITSKKINNCQDK